jgi:hypothetical protein
MQLSFSGSLSIPPGGSFEVHLGVHNPNYAGANWNETKNYSYTVGDTSYTNATNIGLYINGNLVWGMHP